MTHNASHSDITILAKKVAVIGALVWAVGVPIQTARAESSTQYGFYYHPDTQRTYSGAQATFGVRPTSDSHYPPRTEVSINSGSWKSYNGSLKFEDEGLQLIRFRNSDPTLQWTPIQTFRVFVDKTPPRTFPIWEGPSATAPNARTLYVHPDSVLTVVAQDNLAGVEKTLFRQNAGEEGKAEARKFPGKMQFQKEGSYRIELSGVDYVGNTEEWHPHEFWVDSSPPKTEVSIKGGSYKTTDGRLFLNYGSQIILEAEDPLSGVKAIEFRINGGPITRYKEGVLVTDKSISFAFHAVDAVGNSESWRTVRVFQDIAPPQINLTREGKHIEVQGRIYARSGFSIQVECKDLDTGSQILMASRDGNSFENADARRFEFKQPGEHTLLLRAVDPVGNMAESNPITVFIDDTAPQSILSSTDPLSNQDEWAISSIPNRIEISARDEGVGLDQIELSYDGTKYFKFKDPIDLAEWRQNKRTLFYRARDRLGNTESAHRLNIQIKSQAPSPDLQVETESYPEVSLSTLKTGKPLPESIAPENEKEEPKKKAASHKPSKKTKAALASKKSKNKQKNKPKNRKEKK